MWRCVPTLTGSVYQYLQVIYYLIIVMETSPSVYIHRFSCAICFRSVNTYIVSISLQVLWGKNCSLWTQKAYIRLQSSNRGLITRGEHIFGGWVCCFYNIFSWKIYKYLRQGTFINYNLCYIYLYWYTVEDVCIQIFFHALVCAFQGDMNPTSHHRIHIPSSAFKGAATTVMASVINSTYFKVSRTLRENLSPIIP